MAISQVSTPLVALLSKSISQYHVRMLSCDPFTEKAPGVEAYMIWLNNVFHTNVISFITTFVDGDFYSFMY